MDKRRNIFNWNHISSKLTQPEISELKSYYQTYHRKFWGFKQAYKYYKKLRLIGNSLSVIFGVGRSGISCRNRWYYFGCH